MYKVYRSGGKVVVNDWNGRPVFSTDEDSIVLYENANGKDTGVLKNMTDEQLLIALATGIKLSFL